MMTKRPLGRLIRTICLGLLQVIAWHTAPVLALTNGLALTPPMGWNSWNKFGINVSEVLIKEMADAMVTNGFVEAGYQYINIDDAWQSSRGANGVIVADPTRFPSGIKALADYVHAEGLKLGIYSDRGTQTCGGHPGSGGHEVVDADTYAQWGVDYLKYDNCNASPSSQQADYQKMGNALLNSGRPIVYSICAWQFQSWMPNCGNLWRTTMDIRDNWQSVVGNMDSNATLSAYAGPGRWNDPDMLEVGNGGMTTTEYRSHFTMWCMMGAPLILGNDLRGTSQAIKDILTNGEVIGIDQDAAGIQGTRVKKSGNLEVWCKPLGSTNGMTKAVALLNRGTVPANIVVNWSNIGLSDYGTVRDLWAHQELGFFNGSFTAVVPSHGVVALRIAAANPPRLAVLPNGLPLHLRAYGVSNATIVVQTSTNLADWLPLLTNTPASDAWDFLDPNATEPQKFYRFVMP